MSESGKAVLLLLMAAVFWSTSGVLIKLVQWGPLAISGWRSLVAAVPIWLLCRREVRLAFNREQVWAGICCCLFCTAFVASTKLTTAANAILLQYTAPIYVAILAPRLLGEPTPRRDWGFVGLTLLGMALFFLDQVTLEGLLGICLGIAGALLWALMILLVRRQRASSTAGPLVLGNFLTFFCCLPFALEGSPGGLGWPGIVLLGVVSLGLGYAAFARAIKRVTALESILLPTLEPLLNPLWVFLLYGERPGPWALLGGGIVLVAVTARGIIATRGGGGGGGTGTGTA